MLWRRLTFNSGFWRRARGALTAGSCTVSALSLGCGLTDSGTSAGSGGSAGSGAAGSGGAAGANHACEGDRSIHNPEQFAELVAEQCSTLSGTLYVQAHPSLRSLRGLAALSQVGGLSVRNNPVLSSLRGLDALARIRGRVIVHGNTALETLAGLERVTHVKAELEISSNGALTSLGPLQRWPDSAVKGALFIHDNAELPRCQSDAFDARQIEPGASCLFNGVDQCSGNTGTAACEAPDLGSSRKLNRP